MPIYEYICEKCGSHLEVMQKVSDAPLKRCSKCRGKLEKIFSRTSFQLKGGGWYMTDYSGKSASKSEAATKSPKAETTSKKADSAPSGD
jgi:putative FmdB family regulatory protein